MAGSPRIIVSGAGLAGLCLAQGLKGAGFTVAVHESERPPALKHSGTASISTVAAPVESTNACQNSVTNYSWPPPPARASEHLTVVNRRLRN
jgi:monoamine oxidase